MEFFIDSADIEAIRELVAFLPIDGVTTNPTILTKSGKDPEQVFAELCEVLTEDQKIIAQVVSPDYDSILAEARKIASIRGGKNIVVKIPVTHEGLRAIPAAKAMGIKVLATGIYSPKPWHSMALRQRSVRQASRTSTRCTSCWLRACRPSR